MNDNLDDIGLFDLDGSLANYEDALRSDLADLASPDEPPITDLWDESKPYLEARSRLIKNQPGWWKSLFPIQAGMDVYDVAVEKGFHCQILTKGPKKSPRAWTEKLEWCQQNLGPDVDVHVVSDKKIVYGKFLYDDYPEYMLRWLEHRPRGLGIMPITLYNKDFTHPNVLMYDGGSMEKIRRALDFVKNRQPGESFDLTKI